MSAEIEWKLTAEDTFSHLYATWTFDNEPAARMWLAELNTARYLNPKLEWRTVTRSEWEVVDR